MPDRPTPRAVVSGGAGFIGRAVVAALLDRGWRVTVLDNLLTARAEALAPLRADPRFEFVEQDVSLPFTVEGEVSHVLHLASPASPVDFAAYPVEIVRVGTLGTD